MATFDLTKNIPEWMNQDFFEKVIRHKENDQTAKVIKFEITPASKPGENFASALFRSKVIFSSKYSMDEKAISLIIKAKPVLGPELANFTEIYEKSPFFRIEIAMYGKVLPEIESLLSTASDKDILSPRLIYKSNDPSSVIVMEDVCESGFNVIDRPPEALEDSKKIFIRLAKFHAGTFYLVNENKEDFSDFNYTIFQEPTTAEFIFTKSLVGFCGVMKEWDELKTFLPLMESFSTSYLSKILRTYKPNRNEHGFNVLNHADFHVRNVMFEKSNDGKIADMRFIDFQICNYASPAIDLIYALYNFTSTENRISHRNELISIYHQQFVTSLKDFGYMQTPPTLLDLNTELLRNGHLEVVLLLTTIAAFFYDLSTMTPEDFDQAEGTKRFQHRLYNTPAYKQVILKEFPRFVQNGFL